MRTLYSYFRSSAAFRVRIALQGHMPFQAGFAATVATLNALRAGAKPATLANAEAAALLRATAREPAYQAAMAAYLTAGEV